MISYQTSLKNPAMCAGTGLHTGKKVRLTLKPAPAGTGFVFIRTDIKTSDNHIFVTPGSAHKTELATMLVNDSGVSVMTVEHILSALHGLGVDNAFLLLDGPEVPIIDGSAAFFSRLIRRAGIKTFPTLRSFLKILKPFSYQEGQREAHFLPHDGFMIDVSVIFDAQAIGEQNFCFEVTPDAFVKEVATARTFALLKDIESMRASGRALGGSLDNAVVVDDARILNKEGLHFPNEFARHKALDVLGDLALAQAPLLGCYKAIRPGHSFNNSALRALFSDSSSWCWEMGHAHQENSFVSSLAVIH